MTASRRVRGVFLAGIVAASEASIVLAAPLPRDAGDPFAIAIAEQVTRDDNLYRLPDGVDAAAVVPGSSTSRGDLVSRTSVIADGNWALGQQALALNLALDNNRYADNTSLDNTSGNGRADWNWRLGRDWSGQLGGGYGRSLSSFVNSRFFSKDLLETSDYHGAARYQMTPHWSVSAKTQRTEGSHDAQERQADDFESQASTFGVQYLTRRGDQLGLEYRRTNTSFPTPVAGGGLFSDRDYVDREAAFKVSYAFTVKTSFEGSAGYVWRHYPQSVLGDFAGPVWNAAFHWEPRSKTRIELSQWQELTAYLDAESNHFEARGTRLTGTWLPTTKLTVSLDVSRERHSYTGFDPTALTESPRRDRLWARQLALSYTPVQKLTFDLTWRLEDRGTNRPLYEYGDHSISAGLTLIF